MRRFNQDEMLEYFGKFDYIKYKYGPLLEGASNGDPVKADIVESFEKGFVEHERMKVHDLYEKISYDEIYERLKLIYSDPKDAESFISLYDFSLDKLIDRYLNIRLLDKLFSHHFFEYEWEQHVDMNFDKNEMSFYRDHFIHQIRNCHMIMTYLDEESAGDTYYKKVENALKSRANSISKFACAHVEQYAEHVRDSVSSGAGEYLAGEKEAAAKEIEKLYEDAEGVAALSVGKERINTGLRLHERKLNEIAGKMKGNAEGFAWNYLVRGTLIVAALFHDIGYPMRFVYKEGRSISNYIPLISPTDNIGFDELYTLLHGSLLFTVTDRDRLKKQYDGLDHGALSAYILLLQYYQTGAISGLDPIKRAVIELAAVAIYDHTLKYESLGADKDDKYKCDVREKPSFMDNPLSFTLRFVDDIQEWDRLYFEIHEGCEYLFCQRCKMPMVGVRSGFAVRRELEKLQSFDSLGKAGADKLEDEDLRKTRSEIESSPHDIGDFDDNFSLDYVISPEKGTIYVCGCVDTGKSKDDGSRRGCCELAVTKKSASDKINFHKFPGGAVESGTLFKQQKINYAITCDDVVLVKEPDDLFYIEYSPYRQLYLLILNHVALQYRMKEMAKVPKQFLGQSGVSMDVTTRITDNPMMLKMRILCDFLYETGAYVATFRGFEHNPYKRNFAYYNLFKNNVGDEDDFDLLKSLIHGLKERHFLVYDYDDDGIKGKAVNENGKGITRTGTEREKLCGLFLETAHGVVEFLIGPTEQKKMWPTFNRNLVNILRCYFKILTDFVAFKGDGDSSQNLLAKWLGGDDGVTFSALEAEYFNPEFQDDTYKDACRIIFRDFVSQLYYQNKGELRTYYEKRSGGKRKDSKKEDVWEDHGFVVGNDEMKYALDVLFDERYYNPAVMKGESVNDGMITFFDVHSDMYLFKEMYLFSSDNRKRRLKAGRERWGEKED